MRKRVLIVLACAVTIAFIGCSKPEKKKGL